MTSVRDVSVIPVLLAALAGSVAPARVAAQTLSPYQRSAPAGTPTAEPLALTVADAVRRGLEHNLGLILAEQRLDESGGARLRALSDLLPNANGRVSASRQKVNLEAFGFPLPAGFPPVVGPFNVYDVRVFVSQSLFDLHALNAARSETHNVEAARFDVKNARDIVVLVSANSYSAAVAAAARLGAARAQVDTAQALQRQASDLKDNGLVAGIDVLRSQVQLDTARQRVTAAEADFERSKLQLARIIGLPLGQAFTLDNQIRETPFPEMTLDQAIELAYRSRGDYQAALERVRAADANRRAIAGELVPSVHVTADYGDIGLTPSGAKTSFNVTGAVNVPIFQGGRTRGRLAEADAQLKSRQAEAEDVKAGVYYDVQNAFLDLKTGREQLQVATRTQELAAAQLTQARDRFAAGVTGNIEVVQAQEAVALASDQYIAALFTSNLAAGNLVRALGTAEEIARQYIGGIR
jgi:outer membrane protein TolC